ncbi:Crp/Fnr family transcriptional regulator [Filimonas lacunae]|nr:Crp/Fnr family transcriptional regulator [Filimonas lacunae]
MCKHLGFIIDGVFRSYHVNEENGEEKNILFFTPRQIIAAYKSFLTQTPCNYYIECMTDATIIYILII